MWGLEWLNEVVDALILMAGAEVPGFSQGGWDLELRTLRRWLAEDRLSPDGVVEGGPDPDATWKRRRTAKRRRRKMTLASCSEAKGHRGHGEGERDPGQGREEKRSHPSGVREGRGRTGQPTRTDRGVYDGKGKATTIEATVEDFPPCRSGSERQPDQSGCARVALSP